MKNINLDPSTSAFLNKQDGQNRLVLDGKITVANGLKLIANPHESVAQLAEMIHRALKISLQLAPYTTEHQLGECDNCGVELKGDLHFEGNTVSVLISCFADEVYAHQAEDQYLSDEDTALKLAEVMVCTLAPRIITALSSRILTRYGWDVDCDDGVTGDVVSLSIDVSNVRFPAVIKYR